MSDAAETTNVAHTDADGATGSAVSHHSMPGTEGTMAEAASSADSGEHIRGDATLGAGKGRTQEIAAAPSGVPGAPSRLTHLRMRDIFEGDNSDATDAGADSVRCRRCRRVGVPCRWLDSMSSCSSAASQGDCSP